MKLITKLNDYLLAKMLQKIANDELTVAERIELESIGIDEHARHFIMITNGNVKGFKQMYGNMSDELQEIDKICENLECLANS